MNSRERVLKAVNHSETDRVPFDMFGTYSPGKNRIMKFLKVSTDEEMFCILGIDFWDVGPFWYRGEKKLHRGKPLDEWGIPIENYSSCDSSGYYPLSEVSSIDDVENYKWPVIDNFYTDHIKKEIENHDEYALVGGSGAPIFHYGGWLCGLENMLVNMIEQPEVAEAIIRKITDFWVEYTKKVLEIGKGRIDIIENRNDFGAQDRMFISPELFRRFYKPALKRIYDTAKEYGALILQHSCGSIAPIIPDYIEIGVDILNPIQVTARGMDPLLLKNRYGDKLTFHGGIDTQYILPNGTTEEVRSNVREMINVMGKGGGYVLSGTQGFETDDIPVENIYAMYDEGKKVK